MNTVLRSIIGDYMQPLYFYSDDGEIEHRKLHPVRTRSKQNDGEVEKEPLADKGDLIMRDLFLWAILLNHIDMAKVFLAHMKYRICAALIATRILKQYHSKASHGKLKEDYKASATYFEQYAIDCIAKCEANDANLACEIVLQQIELFGNVTCLQVGSAVLLSLFDERLQGGGRC